MSRATQKGAELFRLRAAADEAIRLAKVGTVEASAQAAALAMTGMASLSLLDEERSWERDRDREYAFAAELWRLATEDGAVLPPVERTRRLKVLAQWIAEGYDGPPTDEDYDCFGDGDEPELPRKRGA